MGKAGGEVQVQPAVHVMGRRRQDDLVERLVMKHLLDRRHRVVPDRNASADGIIDGVLDAREGLQNTRSAASTLSRRCE